MNGDLILLDRKDLTVSMDSKKVLKWQSPDIKTRTYPLNYIDQVVIYGNPKIYCNVWKALADHNIPALLLPSRGKGRPVWVTPGLSTSVMIRKAQHHASENVQMKDDVISVILKFKFLRQLALIEQLAEWFCYEKGQTLSQKIVPLFNTSLTDAQFDEYIHKAKEAYQNNLDRLSDISGRSSFMGHEGFAANVWFSLLKDVLSPEWKFSGRNRRPPKDPINALLSLSYTMAMTEVYKTVNERGMDPCVGFLHEALPGRDSFVLDILEPLRPGADQFSLMIAMHNLQPDNFTISEKEGCRIDSSGRGQYFPNWAQWRTFWPYSIGQKYLDDENDDEFLDLEREDDPFFNKNKKSLRLCCLQIIHEVTQCFKKSPSQEIDSEQSQ